MATVYPRVCGAWRRTPKVQPEWIGLSPRVRGMGPGPSSSLHKRRSIPACAGYGRRYKRNGLFRAVYPRVCGVWFEKRTKTVNDVGLSPCVRGTMSNIQIVKGPIRVYPRVCGVPLLHALK